MNFKTIKKQLYSALSGLLAGTMLLPTLAGTFIPTSFAAQISDYHDPAKGRLQSSNRTVEFDVNAVIRQETFICNNCEKPTMFTIYCVPEYTRSGQTSTNNNVTYSDGTSFDGNYTGNVDHGLPGVDAFYTSYHWGATRF